MNLLNRSLGILVLYFLGLLIGALACLVSGCSTIYGVASDLEQGSQAVRRMMEPSQERIRDERVRRAADLVIAEKGNQGRETHSQN